MDSNLGEMDKNGEELAGRKKSRFKQLKTRLFGKLKKKESDGLMKQSQSASDITAPEGGRESYDSEDECLYPQCLSSRALSHDSIFFSEQPQSTEPTRVLSQENVQGNIKALQLKLQQQNLRLGPPPMQIPSRRTEDSGATSEDDGLPCSPPEMSFHEQVMHEAVYKYPKSKKHLSSLSLAGTGSEEEEQSDPFQPSSRPLSPVFKPLPQPILSPTPALTTPTAGVDISRPVNYTPRLDSSAARHRMSVKPRNQRVSTRVKRAPMASLTPRHRSESVNDLDNILSEEEDDDESLKTTETMRHRLYSSPTLKMREKRTSPEPKPTTPSLSMQNQDEKPTEINLLSPNVETLNECSESEGRVTNNPLYLQPMDSGRLSPFGLLQSTQTSRETEPLRAHSPIQRYHTQNIQISDNKRLWRSSENLLCGTDQKDGILPEAAFSLHPVPPIRNPTLEMRSPTSPKGVTVVSAKSWEVLPEPYTPEISPTAVSKGITGSPSGKDTLSLNSVSFQFSIASAKYRSKTPSESVVKQNDGDLKGLPGIKIKSIRPNTEPQKEEAREMTPSELQNHLQHQTQETKKSNSCRDVISLITSKPTSENQLKKTEMSTEYVDAEKTEEPEDRKNAFGVQLRTTSLSLKYRSDVSKIKDETKRYSLESTQRRPVSEEHVWKAETPKNMCDANSKSKSSLPRKQDSQNLDTQFTATDNARPSTQDTTESNDAVSEPGWMSLAREKTKAYQPLLGKLYTNQSPQVNPPTLPTLQPPKPTVPPKTHLPMKTQLTLNIAIQTSTQQSSQLTTPRSPSKRTPGGNKERPRSPARRVENPISQSAAGGRLADSKDKGTSACRYTTSEADVTKKATVSTKIELTNRHEPILPANTEAPTVTTEPSPSSEVCHHLQPRSDGAEPSWMELAKRKSLAWSDKTLE
ncbi:uncharacterized protein cracdlb isoform X2 [Triplophysa dalaica]|uniref:uncharacterized protein cracdlb isoform X2 n=1 Tax=Triplophysa dalaica TaxID=1582913 RepID=UPI0024DF8EC5|nr:uncharacterized protein cracdlb isoform X2 [Triplophysa dalaica]